MDLTRLEMRQTNSKIAQDMAYGQRVMIITTPDADMKENTDLSYGGFCIAWRRRKPMVTKYGELSIRYERRNGIKTEFQKILDGESKAHLFVFEFPDAWVMCSGITILKALQDDIGYVGEWNHDGTTRAYYIPINKIAHVMIKKSANE